MPIPYPTNTSHFGIRLTILCVFVGLFGGFLLYRLVDLQLLRADSLRASAAELHSRVRMLPAKRGTIYYTDRSGDGLYPLATNRTFFHVYAVPDAITEIDDTIDALFPVVEPYGIDEETLRYRLSKRGDIYEPIAHRVSAHDLEKINALNLSGIAWEEETWRYYPEGETLAHVLGFVGVHNNERVGQYGLEGMYEEELKGVDGYIEGDVDRTGELIQSGDLRRVDPFEGVDVVLTIDRVLQTYACAELEKRIEEVEARGGSVIMVDPKSGAILVMCSAPAFNPNYYNRVDDIGVYVNPAISSTYEPGSIFKPITMAAAIDEGVVNPQTTYIDEGFVKLDEKYTIRNSDGKAHGEVDMITVLDQSLNTGVVFVVREMGKSSFREYVHAFGFGEQSGVELGNEQSGNITTLDTVRSDVYAATASYGQGITVTPLQMVFSYAALANGGKRMKPFIVQETRQNGNTLYHTQPEVRGEPISARAATIISGMLVSVVRDGQAKHAGVPGYYIAGKTGTAQVAQGSGYGDETIHSFAGYGPVDDPAFAMLVKLDNPAKGAFSSSTAAPLFGTIAKFVLQYYNIPPDEAL